MNRRSTASLQHFNYFLNLLLANPASPINPEPRRNIVAGSGTGASRSALSPLTFVFQFST